MFPFARELLRLVGGVSNKLESPFFGNSSDEASPFPSQETRVTIRNRDVFLFFVFKKWNCPFV